MTADMGDIMNITGIEKRMYEVMKAVFDSGIPVDFKGAMVLKACLLEAGYIAMRSQGYAFAE